MACVPLRSKTKQEKPYRNPIVSPMIKTCPFKVEECRLYPAKSSYHEELGSPAYMPMKRLCVFVMRRKCFVLLPFSEYTSFSTVLSSDVEGCTEWGRQPI